MNSVEEKDDSVKIDIDDQKIKISDVFSKLELRNIIYHSLEETGIFFSDTDKESSQDVFLNEYLFDSIQIIRFIVALEQNLTFELSDEIFVKENLETINTLVDVLANMCSKKLSEN